MSVTALNSTPDTTLRLFQHSNPAAALGLAVSHLMGKPAVARLPLGSWSHVLVGQINRKHYHLVLDHAGRTVGFLGWAITDEATAEATAEAWLAGSDTPTSHANGDCFTINVWSAETAAANHLLLTASRQAGAGYRLIYFKRHHPDGSTRMGKLVTPDVMRGKLPALRSVAQMIR